MAIVSLILGYEDMRNTSHSYACWYLQSLFMHSESSLSTIAPNLEAGASDPWATPIFMQATDSEIGELWQTNEPAVAPRMLVMEKCCRNIDS